MAIEQKYSITRTKATWKPRVNEADIPFYSCPACKRIYQGVAGGQKAGFSGEGRAPVAEPPYVFPQEPPTCCGNTLQALVPLELEELPQEIKLDYRILGGYNNNAISFSWELSSDAYTLEWVALKTFTGSQLKYIYPKKRSPLMFAFAEEDAYAYCDESPCLECVFMCKRGFVIYAYIENLGLVRMPLTRMSPYWESRS